MNHPKKILIDLGKLKNRYSGLGEVAFNFGKALSQNIELLKNQNIELHLLLPKKYIGAFGKDLKYVPLNFFRRHLPFLNKKYDLWYATHQDSGYLPRNKKTKFLITVHDLNIIFKPDKKKVAKRLSRLQKKIDNACYLTAISGFTKCEIEKHLSLKNIPVEVIYCGVIDTEKLNAQKPKAINENEQFFFHISTIQPKKNVMVLVDMMKLMPEKKLVIAGSWDSNYAKKILQRIDDEKISNIITLSKVSTNEKAWLFQNCEAFFFPSLHEGFGLPVIESMYCGKPVFLSTYTSLPEIGSDKAFYWNNFDAEYMKNFVIEQMERIKNDDQFPVQLKKYAHEFTWQKNVTAYISLFKKLLL